MTQELHTRQMRQVYLLTYSQADHELCSSREEFAEKVTGAFAAVGQTVTQWVCCQEPHQAGGVHYHMAVKLAKVRRWLRVKQFLETEHHMVLHFSGIHSNYYTAYQYVTKEDTAFITSPDHPDLGGSAPETGAASGRRRGASTSAGTSPKRRRLTPLDVSEIVRKHGIHTRTELLALAEQQRRDGKTDLVEFVVNRGAKRVAEAISVAWELEGAEAKLQREQMSRTDILRSYQDKECVEGCSGQWRDMAEQIIANNGLSQTAFPQAVFEALDKGRGKYRNIMITGPANCGKTFILSPLTQIFHTFSNPASTSFAWVGAEEAEVIFLNDFRWSQQIIPWHDFLLLLEGQLVHLPAPKTHFAKDLVLSGSQAIFATGKTPIVYIKGGQLDERETEMMSVRWRQFHFQWQIPPAEQRDIPACGPCFARFLLQAL